MAESPTGLSELMEFLDLDDSNYETDFDVEILIRWLPPRKFSP